MESETRLTEPSTSERVLAAAGPVLWIAISYVDPGKWAATVEGGARFGLDSVLFVFVVTCAAILCQYLSAHVAIATGKDLGQICCEEYDEGTRVLLGVQAEISFIALDLAMVLGTAYGLNAFFGIDLFSCVLFTGFDALLFPFLANLLEIPKAKFSSICLATFILVSYACGVPISQSESSPSTAGMISMLSGENAYALMSLLGANIAPHNFYLHSSIVEQDDGRRNVSKRALCQDHFFATVCIFSGIFLVNCMLVTVASNVFYDSGLVSLTLQDALSLLDQVSRSSVASFALVMVIFFSSRLVPLPWSLGRQVISHDFLGLEIPCWLHRATIRLLAIIPALYGVWSFGAEGIFQLLIFAQVVVALLLPSSVIPLFRVASSKSIMGDYKISHLVRLLALSSFVAMLTLKIVFVMELIFGSSDWVSNLRWSVGSSIPILYVILIVVALCFLGFLLWLAITPLRSDISGVDKYDEKVTSPKSSIGRDQPEVREVQYQLEKSVEKNESGLIPEKSLGDHKILSTHGSGLNLPDQLFDSEINLDLNTNHDDKSEITFAVDNSEVSATISETVFPEPAEIYRTPSQDAGNLCTESKDVVEKTLKIEGDVKPEKDDEGDSWEPEESSKDASASSPTLLSEGPGSFRSLSGKLDDVGSGAGSLSRLAGLGRAARRQLTVILDEFWRQLFDFHGQLVQDAKTKKLEVLLGVDSRVDLKSSFASVKLESINKESTGYLSSTGGRGADSSKTSSFYHPSLQQIGHSNVGSPLGLQQGSSMWSNQMQMLGAYDRSSAQSTVDPSEKRYYSVRYPSASDGYDQQPATIHGYNLTTYLSRMAKEKGFDYVKAQLESLVQTSSSTIKSNTVDSYSPSLNQKLQNGMRTLKPPGFHNVPVSRNSSLKFARPIPELHTPEPTDYNSKSSNVKKFCSLPNISGLYVPQRDSTLAGSSTQWDTSVGYGLSVSRPVHEQTCSSASSWAGTALGHNELSPKVCRDAFSLQFASTSGVGSLWSKQPYERFGVADKSPPKIQETPSFSDVEAMLLQSFRCCIRKLLKLEGSDWLFRQNDGADEDLIDRVAAREKFLNDIETRASEMKLSSDLKADEIDQSKFISVPHCGDGCVWRGDLIISFGVWCIHRILELSLVESRPELWGKYTYVLNRLQGIIDPAFSKPRSSTSPCFCLQLPVGYQPNPSPPITNDSLPPPSKIGRGKFTTAPMLLDIIKDVEVAISCRKGRTGTAAGDVAFPKGKENLASVLKRYKRRLSNKPVGSQETRHGLQSKNALSPTQGL